jgi:hypothetical protein
MIIRKLTPEEWFRIGPTFAEEFGEMPPSPFQSTVVVAEDAGEIVAFLTVQSVIHVEPLWVKKSHRGHYILPLLVSKVRSLFPDLGTAFAYTKNPRLAKLLEHMGMQELDWKVFRWRKSNG